MTTVAVPPTRVATTGRSAASASIATTGVPSFAEVRSMASNAAYQSRHLLLEPDEPAPVLDAELARERLGRLPVLAVSHEHEHRVDALVEERAQRADEVERPLDRRQPAGPADDERLVFDAQLGSNAAPASSSAALHSGRSKP